MRKVDCDRRGGGGGDERRGVFIFLWWWWWQTALRASTDPVGPFQLLAAAIVTL